MKKIFLLIIFFAFIITMFAQTPEITINSKSSIILNEMTNETGNTIKTFFHLQSNSVFQIFSLVDDTVHGDYYEFYSNGVLKEWIVFDKGKIWELKGKHDVNGNEIFQGKLKEGSGYISNYIDHFVDSSLLLEVSYEIYNWYYFIDGYYTGLKKHIFTNEDMNYYSYQEPIAHKYGFLKSNTELNETVKLYNDSLFFNDPIYYHGFFNKYKNPEIRYILTKNFIVISIENTLTGNHIILKPNEFFIPEMLSNPKREKFLNKMKRKLIPLYEKYSIHSEFYLDEYRKLIKNANEY
jgi:hypothetical protein